MTNQSLLSSLSEYYKIHFMSNEKSKLEEIKLRYEIWSNEIKPDLQTLGSIAQGIHSNINMLNKNLLYISSGAIALSIPILSQLSGIDISFFGKLLLILAWIFFALTILTTLFSFKFSTNDLVSLQQERMLLIAKSRQFFLTADIADDHTLKQSLEHTIKKFQNGSDNNEETIFNEYDLTILLSEFSIYNFLAGICFLSFFLIKLLLTLE